VKTDALSSLFALLDTDEDDFASLVKRFGIDPANDLQNCDLTNVDFGRLTADTLNLTGSELEGADLSKVVCRQVIGADVPSGKPNVASASLITLALSSVARYQNADWVLNQIISNAEEGAAPIMAFYDSTAEQDLLTKRVCAHFGDHSHLRQDWDATMIGMKFLWFYCKASTAQLKLNPAFLDKAFFEALRGSNQSDDFGIYPLTPNRSAISRIKASTHGGDYGQMRRNFIRGLREELGSRSMSGLVTYGNSAVLFSGFPPISKRFYTEIRESLPGRLRLIFLCSSAFEQHYLEAGGKNWRRFAVPGYSIGPPLAVAEDVRRLVRRVGLATQGKISVPNIVENKLDRLIGRPLTELKAQLRVELQAMWDKQP